LTGGLRAAAFGANVAQAQMAANAKRRCEKKQTYLSFL
jgi:hypothetical protein